MADVKISELAEATSLADTDVLAGVNSNTTRKFSLARLKTFFFSALTKSDVGLGNVANVLQYSADNPPPTPSKADIGLGNVANVLQYSADNPPPSNKITVATDTVTGISGVLTGNGSTVGYKSLDTSTLTNDNDHIPTSGSVKSALESVPLSAKSTIANANLANIPGVYETTTSTTNLPNARTGYLLVFGNPEGTYGCQIFVGATGSVIYFRDFHAGSFDSWRQFTVTVVE